MGFEFVKKSMSISLEHSLSCNDQGQKPPYLTTLDRSIPRMRTEVLRPLLQKCNVCFKCYSEDDSECSAFSIALVLCIFPIIHFSLFNSYHQLLSKPSQNLSTP